MLISLSTKHIVHLIVIHPVHPADLISSKVANILKNPLSNCAKPQILPQYLRGTRGEKEVIVIVNCLMPIPPPLHNVHQPKRLVKSEWLPVTLTPQCKKSLA